MCYESMALPKIKKPWIPTGKNTSMKKVTSVPTSVPKGLNNTRIEQKQCTLLFAMNSKQTNISEIRHSKHHDMSLDAPGALLVDLSSIDEESDSISSAPSDLYSIDYKINISSIKAEATTLKIYFQSLKRSMQFLDRYFHSIDSQDKMLRKLFISLQEEVKNMSFEEFKFLLKNIQGGSYDNFAKLLQCKENLLSKLFECYGKALTIFESTLDNQVTMEIMKINSEPTLKEQILDYEKKYSTQNAVIKDYERRISISQGKISTLENYKTSLEDSRKNLQKELSQKDNKIRYLSSELSKSQDQPNMLESDSLVKCIEEMGQKLKSEKSALKRALKYQKSCADEAKSTIDQLKEVIVKKEKMLFEVVSERDQLRSHLTVLNNQVLEAKILADSFKSQNVNLHDQFSDQEVSFKNEMRKLNSRIQETSSELDESKEQNLKLKEYIENLKSEMNEMSKELQLYKSKQIQQHSLVELEKAGGDSASQGCVLKEIRDFMLDLKTYQDSNIPISRNNSRRNSELEKQLRELRILYENSIKENDSLKKDMSEKKTVELRNVEPTLPEQNPIIADNQFFNQNLQVELKLKTEENWRLKQRERNLEYQIEEIKEKLQRKEIDTVKLFSLEEELNTKKRELVVLERRREEEIDKFQQTIKDLQEALDIITIDRNSLQKHLERVKASVENVFDNFITLR